MGRGLFKAPEKKPLLGPEEALAKGSRALAPRDEPPAFAGAGSGEEP